MTTIFPDKSSFISLFAPGSVPTQTRTVALKNVSTFAVPIPLGPRGLYASDAYGWNEFYKMEYEAPLHFLNVQLFILLLSQYKTGTPALYYNTVKHITTKEAYDNILSKKTNFSSPDGSTIFDMRVAEKYRQVHAAHGRQHAVATDLFAALQQQPTDDDDERSDENSSAAGHNVLEDILGIGSGGSKLLLGNHAAQQGYNADTNAFGMPAVTTRNKFDIMLVPVFKNPSARTFKARELCGAILIAFCYDPLWDMMQAWRDFVRTSNEYSSSPSRNKITLRFNVEEQVRNQLTLQNSANVFNTHFMAYTGIDEALHDHISTVGGLSIEDPEARVQMTQLWNLNLAVRHIAKFAERENDAEWMAHYTTRLMDPASTNCEFKISAAYEPYILPYDRLVWNTANMPNASEHDCANPTGLYHQFFPWVEKYNAAEIEMFYRNDKLDLATVDSTPLHESIRLGLQQETQGSQHTFMPGSLNAIVALSERVGKTRMKLTKALDDCVNNFTKATDMLLRDRYDGKELRQILGEEKQQQTGGLPLSPNNAFSSSSSSPLSSPQFKLAVKECNDELESVTIHCNSLHDFEMRINDFMSRRILTTRVKKPLTEAIAAIVNWVEGSALSAKVPQEEGQSVSTTTVKALRDRLLSAYKIANVEDGLDPFAQNIMHYATVMRYVCGNAGVHDLMVLRHGCNDAYRYALSIHFNFASTGPAAASKSHAIKMDKFFRVPNTVSSYTNFSAQAFSSYGDYSDHITSMDELPQSMIGKPSKGNSSDFSPETAQWKAQLSQGFNVRLVLDIGKSFKDRASRLVVSVMSGSVNVVSNIPPHDQALMSRFYHSIVPGLIDDTNDQTNRGEKKKDKVDIQDLIFHIPNMQHRAQLSLFHEKEHIEHALVALVNKLMQAGALPEVSMDISIVPALMYKYIKTQMHNGTPNLRAMQRPILLARSMTIARAVNLLFNVPGINEELHTRPWELILLQYVKPYLACTLQTMLLAFSLLINEVYQPVKTTIYSTLLYGMLGQFPSEIVHNLLHQRNIDRAGQRFSTEDQLQRLSAEDQHFRATEPLWAAYQAGQFEELPLAALYRDERFTDCFRRMTPSSHVKHGRVAAGPMAQMPNAEERLGRHQFMSSVQNELVDLNYISTGLSFGELVKRVTNHIKPPILEEIIASTLRALMSRTIRANAVAPMSVADLAAMEPGTPLPRVEREMNYIETTDNDRLVYICIHLFDEVVDKDGNNAIIQKAFRSIFYQRLEPRKLLLGTEMTKNYDVQFDYIEFTREDLVDSPKYLHILDPSQIQARLRMAEDGNASALAKIQNNMDMLVEQHTALIKKYAEEKSKKNKKKGEEQEVDPPLSNKKIAKMQKTIDTVSDVAAAAQGIASDSMENSSNALSLLDALQDGNNNDKNNYTTVKCDIDEWVIIKHFLRVGIRMRINPVTGVTECLPYAPQVDLCVPEDQLKWQPLPTPANLIKQHGTPKKTDEVIAKESMKRVRETSEKVENKPQKRIKKGVVANRRAAAATNEDDDQPPTKRRAMPLSDDDATRIQLSDD